MRHQDITVLMVSCGDRKCEEAFLSSLGYQLLPTEHNGIDALNSIRINKPQVVLCEAFLPKLDFCGMLDVLQSRKYEGVLIGVSVCQNDKLAARMMNKGADYFYIYPYEYEYLTVLIDAFVEEKIEQHHIPTRTEVSRRFQIEDCVIKMLHYLGMPTNLLGYKYIRQAILFALEDESFLRAITARLYSAIADVFDTKSNAVERAIRTAISVAWDRGDHEAQLAVFGYTIADDKGKPTNGEFLTKIVNHLRIKLAAL